MIFTKRTGLENLTNQAVHEIVEGRKKKPLELEESNEISQEQPKEKNKETAAQFTYGTNSANSETHRALFNGSYHTFSTSSTNQMQCTCCPDPILMNVKDSKEESKTNYLTTSTFTETKTDYLSAKPKKSSYSF